MLLRLRGTWHLDGDGTEQTLVGHDRVCQQTATGLAERMDDGILFRHRGLGDACELRPGVFGGGPGRGGDAGGSVLGQERHHGTLCPGDHLALDRKPGLGQILQISH